MGLPARKNERFDLRASAQQRAMIEEAANRRGQSYTDFILNSATEKALDVLAERRVFILDDEQWNRFNQALDSPAKPVPALVQLFKDPV